MSSPASMRILHARSTSSCLGIGNQLSSASPQQHNPVSGCKVISSRSSTDAYETGNGLFGFNDELRSFWLSPAILLHGEDRRLVGRGCPSTACRYETQPALSKGSHVVEQVHETVPTLNRRGLQD